MPRRPTIRRLPWAAYLWPGLPHLWNAGSIAGLALAIGFGVLLNVTILSTLVWPEWLPQRVTFACGLTTLGLWLVALWETRGELRRQAARSQSERAHTDGAVEENSIPESREPSTDSADPPSKTEPSLGADIATVEPPPPPIDHWFREAQHAYLTADWVRAERLLRRLLRTDRDDIEGLLLMASVWRLSDRRGRAARLLGRLARRQDAQPWRDEIQRELGILQAESSTPEENELNADGLEATVDAAGDGQQAFADGPTAPQNATDAETPPAPRRAA